MAVKKTRNPKRLSTNYQLIFAYYVAKERYSCSYSVANYRYLQVSTEPAEESAIVCHQQTHSYLYQTMCRIKPRVHNIRREGEYPTLTIPCTNALPKVWSGNHRVLSFCINVLRETKDLLIGVNSIMLGIVETR